MSPDDRAKATVVVPWCAGQGGMDEPLPGCLEHQLPNDGAIYGRAPSLRRCVSLCTHMCETVSQLLEHQLRTT